MIERDELIGGGTSTLQHALLFCVGVAVGSGVRLGMWLLPKGLVTVVKGRLR